MAYLSTLKWRSSCERRPTRFDDDTHLPFAQPEIATIRSLAQELPWAWAVRHEKVRIVVIGDDPVSHVWLQPQNEHPVWLPTFAIRHTKLGWWADLVVADDFDQGEVFGPCETLEAAFASIPERLSATQAGWGLQFLPNEHAATAA